MAKKKSSQKISESEPLPRKGPRSRAELVDDLAKLRKKVGEMLGMLEEMQREKIDSLNIDGLQKIDRATELMSEYVGNVWMALYRERTKLGLPTRLPVSEDT